MLNEDESVLVKHATSPLGFGDVDRRNILTNGTANVALVGICLDENLG